MAEEKDNFKPVFKYYKSRQTSPDLSNVLNFQNIQTKMPEDISHVQLRPPNLPMLEGLAPVDTWKVYTINHIPGFYFIQNPFKAGYQRYWVKRCLHDFPNKPNVCNLDAHMSLDSHCNLWHHSLREKEKQNMQKSSKSREKTLMDKLRWATLGYHHNWDTKEYSLTEHTPFPADLSYLCRLVVEALGLSASYRAEAAIVNYYHLDSTLAGHTDHSEFDQEAPLVSASFGESAVFLVGGTTKATTPTAMFLHSGDITVMSGPSRLAYHAVPRVLASAANDLPLSLQLPTDPVDDSVQFSACGERSAVVESVSSSPDKTPASHVSHSVLEGSVSTSDAEAAVSSCVCAKNSSGKSSEISESAPDLPTVLPATGQELTDCVQTINQHIRTSMLHMDFGPFREYLRTSRINMNVRQVFRPGQTVEDVLRSKIKADSDHTDEADVKRQKVEACCI